MKKIFPLIAAFSAATAMSATDFAGGDGSAANPYQITTAEQLQAMKDAPGSHYLMMNDIDLDGVKWTPIGSNDAPFTGTFNGGGYTIWNFTEDSGVNGFGLFARCNDTGVIENFVVANADLVLGNWVGIVCSTNGNWERQGGTIRNVEVRDSYINGATSVAAIAGCCDGFVENCVVINTTVECDGASVGGIAGTCTGGKQGHFYDCVFSGNVTGSSIVGGICGEENLAAEATVPLIKNCVVYGKITGTGAGANVGGICAQDTWWDANTNPHWYDNNCVFADIRGGIIGGINGNGQMGKTTNCYVTGELTVTSSFDEGLPWNGGISATCYNPTLADVYFGGKMVDQSGSTAAKIGAVLGRQWDTTTIRNAFFNDECGAPAIGETVVGMTMVNVTPLLPEQMTDMSNFTFSEPARWQNVAGETMPFFANQTAPLKITEATTVSLNGTCSPDLERVVITGSISETLYNEVEIADGKWSVDFDNDDVIEGETLTVFGFDKNKMPSMVSSAKVVKGSQLGLITSVATDASAIRVHGNKVVFGCEAAYAVTGLSGMTVMKGVASEVTLDGLASGCYIVTATVNGTATSVKAVVK